MSDLSNKNCPLITSLFLNITDILLAGLSFITLIAQRNWEKKPRPYLIWIFDINKQVVGATLVHWWNIIISFFIFNTVHDNLYVWNFANFFIDSTLGIILVSGIHTSLCSLSKIYFGENSSYSRIGHYGCPPDYQIMITQLLPYLASLIINRVITFTILYKFYPVLINLGEQHFFSLYPYPELEKIILFKVCPWILVTFKIWMVDFILKDKQSEPKATEDAQSSLQTSSFTTHNVDNQRLKMSTEEENSDTETQITI